MGDEPVPWRYSHAKAILAQYIMEGTVTEESNPRDVYLSNEEYMLYSEKRFKSNLKSLLKTIEKKEDLAQFDKEALAHDQELYRRPNMTVRGYPFWDTSEARILLVQDIKDRIDIGLKPRQLWLSREEYQAFPLDVFRQHIYQERSTKKQSNYWYFMKKKKKEKKKEYWGY